MNWMPIFHMILISQKEHDESNFFWYLQIRFTWQVDFWFGFILFCFDLDTLFLVIALKEKAKKKADINWNLKCTWILCILFVIVELFLKPKLTYGSIHKTNDSETLWLRWKQGRAEPQLSLSPFLPREVGKGAGLGETTDVQSLWEEICEPLIQKNLNNQTTMCPLNPSYGDNIF